MAGETRWSRRWLRFAILVMLVLATIGAWEVVKLARVGGSAHADGLVANLIVHNFMPVQNAQRICAHFIIDLDAENAVIVSQEINLARFYELRMVNSRNAVGRRSAGKDLSGWNSDLTEVESILYRPSEREVSGDA